MNQFSTGDRILTASGRCGAVINSNPTDFPLHCLVRFDLEDKPLLILKTALSHDAQPMKAKGGKKSHD